MRGRDLDVAGRPAWPLFQFVQPSLEEPSFGLLLGEVQGALIRSVGLFCSTQFAAEVRPRRVGEIVVSQFAPRKNGIDQFQSSQWTDRKSTRLNSSHIPL